MSEYEPEVGDVLGDRYEVLAEIGRGGMATVYRGRDLRLGRTVALKVFRAGVAEAVDPRRTSQEMQLLAGVDHPSVVAVLDAANESGPFGTYLVMELVHGADLGTALARAQGPLPADLARRIVADVAGALAALHERGMVHRDVKPANVLVVAEATGDPDAVVAKLTDFGIAQMVDATRITAPESILGTAAYLSPEQVRGTRPHPPSDVYALGLVLLETLTGVRAFPGSAVESAMARLTTPPALPANASPALAELLSRMTALDPAERPTAAAVATALRSSLAGGVTVPDAVTTARTPAASVRPLTGPAMRIDPQSTAPVARPVPVPLPVPINADGPAATEVSHRSGRRRLATALGVVASTAAVVAAGAVIAAFTGVSPTAPAEPAQALKNPTAATQKASSAPEAGPVVGGLGDVADAAVAGSGRAGSAAGKSRVLPSARPTGTPSAGASTAGGTPAPVASTTSPADPASTPAASDPAPVASSSDPASTAPSDGAGDGASAGSSSAPSTDPASSDSTPAASDSGPAAPAADPSAPASDAHGSDGSDG